MKKRPSKPTTLGHLAEIFGARVSGDDSTLIRGVAPLDLAREGDLTFVTNAKYLKAVFQTKASAVLMERAPEGAGHKPLLLHANPYACLARLIAHFHPAPVLRPGVRRGAFVEKGAKVHKTACVLPGAAVCKGAVIGARTILYSGAYVGDESTVGEDCVLYPNAVVRERCHLGSRVVLQPGCVIGGDGFGFAKDGDAYLKIPQVGNVVLEDDVEIGACTTIDRAVLGCTRIGKGSKLDNQIMIGHNCEIGEHTVMAAQTGISGSSRVGRHCVLGGQVGLAGHLVIGDKVTLATRTGVMEDLPNPGVYWGSPSMPMKEEMKNVAAYRDLPQLVKRLRRAERALSKLDPSFLRKEEGEKS